MEQDAEVGDAPAERLALVYSNEIHRLVGLARLLSGSAAAGEDLAHDVFVRVLRMTAQDPSALRDPAWPLLRTVLTRLAAQRRRQMTRELARLIKVARRPQDDAWTPETVDFVAALQTLPPRMRACVALFYGEDLSTATVAETLGCSQRTVENHLRAARPRLGRLLAFDEGAHT